MKHLINLKFLGALSLISILMVSCLKDDGYDNGEYGLGEIEGKELITIPFAKNIPNSLALESKNSMQTVDLFATNYDFSSPAATDITVELELNNALVPTTNTVLPANVYTIASYSVVIPKGERLSDYVTMNINTGTLNPNLKYGIGFSIKSVSKAGVTIASNLRNVVFEIALKNKYDGKYQVNGTMVDAFNATFVGQYPLNVQLITSGPLSVDYSDVDYGLPNGGRGHIFNAGGGASYYGSFSPVFIFDNNDNVIEVRNFYGQPAAGATARSARINPAGINKYDPATKTLSVSYYLVQAGVDRSLFTEVFTYQGPR